MSKLEKRLREGHEKGMRLNLNISWPSYLQERYNEATEKKQFVLANEIAELIAAEINS